MPATVSDVLAWLEPNALLLALALPPLIRLVGHLIPEEAFMVAMGVLAARAPSSGRASVLLLAVLASQLASDQLTYLAGAWIRPRLQRWPRLGHRLEAVTDRLRQSPAALAGLVPARVLPLGRGAWLAGCGVVGIRWPVFAAIDLAALVVHVMVWCGMGWWLAGDLVRLQMSAETARATGFWFAAGIVTTLVVIMGWRRLPVLGVATIRAVRLAGQTLGIRPGSPPRV